MVKTKIFTRADYMSGKCTHDEYYDQFVTEEIKGVVLEQFGSKIVNSSDPHFNDIDLKKWDNLANWFKSDSTLHDKLKEREDVMTLSSLVCTLKAAARHIRGN